MKRVIFLIVLIFTLFLITMVLTRKPVRYENDYKGKIIDADTGKPIEGVVVLGTWFKSSPTPGGEVEKFYDAREVVTDSNGGFTITGMGLLIFSNIEPMDVLIFKAGYEYKYLGVKKNNKSKSDIANMPLKKLTMKERKKLRDPDWRLSAQIPDAKMRLMLKEINKDRKERGL